MCTLGPDQLTRAEQARGRPGRRTAADGRPKTGTTIN